jgi:hypothetical protein
MDNSFCDVCREEPGAHSFTYYCRTQKKDTYEYVFYTCVGDARRYGDADNVVKHYQNCLNMMNPDSWIWIFNCDGFTMRHYMELSTIKKLTKAVNEYGKVRDVYIVNSSGFMDLVFKLIKPILDNETFKKIKIVDTAKLMKELDLNTIDEENLRETLAKKYC